jgi:DNA-binding NtrC family response regulator
MSCTEESEASQVSQALLHQKTGVLITYRSAQDLIQNAPAGAVAMVILAGRECPAEMGRALQWLRRRQPHCPVAVIADVGAGKEETTARAGGAIADDLLPLAHDLALILSAHGFSPYDLVETSDRYLISARKVSP